VTLATIVVVIMGAADVRGDALIAGLALGIAVAAVTSWRLSRPLDNLWQRGVVSVLAVFGALITALILTTLVHRMLGLIGLAILAVVLFGAGIAGGRWAISGRGPQDEIEPAPGVGP
jgi:hypothetical protein